MANKDLYSYALYSVDGCAVASSSGIILRPDGLLGTMASCDLLLVISSYDYRPLATRETLAAARKAHGLAGLDTGTCFLARAESAPGHHPHGVEPRRTAQDRANRAPGRFVREGA